MTGYAMMISHHVLYKRLFSKKKTHDVTSHDVLHHDVSHLTCHVLYKLLKKAMTMSWRHFTSHHDVTLLHHYKTYGLQAKRSS